MKKKADKDQVNDQLKNQHGKLAVEVERVRRVRTGLRAGLRPTYDDTVCRGSCGVTCCSGSGSGVWT